MRSVVISVGILILLSGCAASSARPAAAPTSVAPTVGRVDGLVYDTEFNPLAGVRITLTGHEPVAITDARGAFSLRDVAPGEHELRAELAGHRPATLGVSVVAGEALRARLELEAIPSSATYHELVLYNAYMTLGVATPLYAVRPGLDAGDDLVFARNASTDARSLVLALTWQTTSAAGSDRYQIDAILDDQLYNQTIGASPLVNRVDGLEKLQEPQVTQSIWLPRTCDYYTPATCAAEPPDTLLALSTDQRFELYSTIFYGEAAPVGFTGLPET